MGGWVGGWVAPDARAREGRHDALLYNPLRAAHQRICHNAIILLLSGGVPMIAAILLLSPRVLMLAVYL